MSEFRYQHSSAGPTFSRIALGMWRLAAWQMTAAQRRDFVHQALDLGITTIDHADIYGSEQPFGEALRLAPSLRDRIEIVTKCGIILNGERSYYNTSAEHIIASLDSSLRHLATDHVDVLLIHRPDALMDADEIAGAFDRLHKAGKVRHFGVSNFTPAQLDLLASRCPLVANQIELSPLHISPLHDGTLDQCQQRRIAPMIWSALGGGRLFSENSEQALRIRRAIEELGQFYDVAPTTIVYAWLLQHPSKPVVLTGSGKIATVREAAAAIDVTLSRAHWYQLWNAASGTPVP